MSQAPTAKQSLRRVIVGLFPWLPGFVSVAGAKGKGLAIRAAGGLLHLAGGPDDPAVHRTGDPGVAGTLTITNIPSGGGPPTGVVITYVTPDGGISTVTLTGTLLQAAPDALPIPILTKAGPGSEKVTCA